MERERLSDWLDRIYATADTEIDCERLQAALPAYVDMEVVGGSPTGEVRWVKEHLAQCVDCADEYRGLREVALLEARHRLPEAEDLLAQFDEEPAPEQADIEHPDQIPTRA